MVNLSSRAASHRKEKGLARFTRAISRMFPWIVSTFGQPEKTALSAQSSSVLAMHDLGLDDFELLPDGPDAALVTGPHPADLRHV
jgi:hypothetical protein